MHYFSGLAAIILEPNKNNYLSLKTQSDKRANACTMDEYQENSIKARKKPRESSDHLVARRMVMLTPAAHQCSLTMLAGGRGLGASL